MKRFDELKQRARLAWAILVHRDGGLLAHAERELPPADGDAMQALMNQNLIDMVRVFGTARHSGFSAGYARNALNQLLAFESLGPLTGEPDEWQEVGPGVHKNLRCGRVFKQADRFDGQAYDLEAIVWRDPNGVCFTNFGSMQPVTFPYYPKTEYRDALPT